MLNSCKDKTLSIVCGGGIAAVALTRIPVIVIVLIPPLLEFSPSTIRMAILDAVMEEVMRTEPDRSVLSALTGKHIASSEKKKFRCSRFCLMRSMKLGMVGS